MSLNDVPEFDLEEDEEEDEVENDHPRERRTSFSNKSTKITRMQHSYDENNMVKVEDISA